MSPMTGSTSRSEATRLGRRGSYRLGTLAAAGLAGPRPPRPFKPRFGDASHRVRLVSRGVAAVAGAAALGLSAAVGLWFVPFLVGLGIGAVASRGRWRQRLAFPVIGAVVVAGWAGTLWLQARRGLPVAATTRMIVAHAGLPAATRVGLGPALAASAVLTIAGMLLGRAITPRPDLARPVWAAIYAGLTGRSGIPPDSGISARAEPAPEDLAR